MPFISYFAQVLQRNPGQLDRVLSSLDPATHSLGYLAALVARWEDISNDDDDVSNVW